MDPTFFGFVYLSREPSPKKGERSGTTKRLVARGLLRGDPVAERRVGLGDGPLLGPRQPGEDRAQLTHEKRSLDVGCASPKSDTPEGQKLCHGCQEFRRRGDLRRKGTPEKQPKKAPLVGLSC